MKKGFLALAAAALIACLTGIADLYEGIAARGWGGVNYGRVMFPLLIGCFALWMLRKKK